MTSLVRTPNVLWIVIICLLECAIANDVNALTSNEYTNQFLHPNDGFDKVDNNPSVEELYNNKNNIEDANDNTKRKPTTQLISDQIFIEEVGKSDHDLHTKADAVNNKFAKVINHNPTENVVIDVPIGYDRANLNEIDVDLNKKYGYLGNNYVNHDYGSNNVAYYPGVQIYPISYAKPDLNDKYLPSSTEEVRNKDLIKSKWDYHDITTIYLAGYDDQIFKLMYDIQKHGTGTELLVSFYIYSNNKYCNIGYLYTSINVLRKCIANYSHYFCLDNNSGTSCLESLGIFKPHELSNIPMDSDKHNNIAKLSLMNNTGIKGDNSETISNIFYKLDTTMNGLKECYPAKQSSDAYEFILPRENDMSSEDIYINLHINKNTKADENIVLDNDNLNIKNDNDVNLSNAVKSYSKTNQQEKNGLSETPSNLNIETSAKTSDVLHNLENVSYITSDDISVNDTASQEINRGQNDIEFLSTSNLSDKKSPEMQVQSSSHKGHEYNKLISNPNILVTEEKINNNPQNNIVSSPGQDSIDIQNSMVNDTDFLLNNNAIVELNESAPGIENIDSDIYTLNTSEHGLEELNAINDTVDGIFLKDKNVILTGYPINRVEDIRSYLENSNILNDEITTDIMPNTVKKIVNQGYGLDIFQNKISQSGMVDKPIIEDNNNIILTVDVEPHIVNSDDATKFTPVKATHMQKSNLEKDGMVDGMASVTPDIDLINQKPIHFEGSESLDYVNNNVPPECTNVKSDERSTENEPWKTDIVSESLSETIVKSTKPNDVSFPKLDTNVEKVPHNFVVQQPFNNVNYQLFNTNQYPHIHPWSLQFEGIRNQNQPIVGDVNKKINIPAYWPLNISQKTLKGIYDHNKLGGNIHAANLYKQINNQDTNFQTTPDSLKFTITPNPLKAPSNIKNIVKYLEPTANQNLQNFAIGKSIPINYHTTLGKKIVNALYIPDPCMYKNILTLENNVSPKIPTVNSPNSNDLIRKEGLLRDNNFVNTEDNISTKQILNELPISKNFNVYLTNLPHTWESLPKNIYTDTKSNEIPLKIRPIPLTKHTYYYPGLRYNNKFYQNINEALETVGERTPAIDTEIDHTALGESVLNSINKYSPIHHTLKPTKINDDMANNVPELKLNKPILNYIDEKTQIPAKYNNSISDGNSLQDPQRDIVQFLDFHTTPSHIYYSYDNTLSPFKYSLIPLRNDKDALGPLSEYESLLNKDETSSSKFLPYTLKPSYFTGSPDLPINWHPSLSVTTKPNSNPFFPHPVARMSALNPLSSLQIIKNSAYIPSPSFTFKPSHFHSISSANHNPDQSLSFTNPQKLAFHQSPGLPISQKSAYYQYPYLLYYPFHLPATSLYGSQNQIKFAPSPKYQLSTANIPSTSAQIGENTTEDDVPQNNILTFNDGNDVNTQPRAMLNQLDSLALKPSINSLTKSFSLLDSSYSYVKPNIIDSTHLRHPEDLSSPFKNTVPGHVVSSSTLKPKGITRSYNSPLFLSMPQQKYNLMQSSVGNNINSYSPILSSQYQIYPHTLYLRPDAKYPEIHLLSPNKSSIPELTLNVPSDNVFRFHQPTSDPYSKLNEAPNLNLISPVSFASGDEVETLSPITKSDKTQASLDLNMYKTYPYLPCAIHANSKSNFIEKPEKMYSTIFNPQISTLQPAASSTDSTIYLFSPNSIPYDAKLSSIPYPQSTVSVKSNTILTEPESLFSHKKHPEKYPKFPFTDISSFPFVAPPSRPISSSSLPTNILTPIKLKETEPYTLATCNVIPSYPYLSQTSSSITQTPFSENHATLPCSNSPYSCSPLNKIMRILPWKSRTQNLPSETIKKIDLYGTPSKAYFLKNKDSFKLPSQETCTDPLKFKFSSQGTNVRPSPINQNINYLNMPLFRQSNIPQNSNLGLLPQIFDKLPNEINTLNTEIPNTLASNIFSVKPEESATLTPKWVSPYASFLLQSRDTLVPGLIKNPNIPSPVDTGTKPCRSDFNKLYYAPNLHKYTSYVKPALQENLQNINVEIPFSQVSPSKLSVSPNIDNNMPYDLGLSTVLLPSTFNFRASSLFPSTYHLNMRPLSPYTTVSTNDRGKLSTPLRKQNFLNILIPKSKSISYTSELGAANCLPGTVTNKVVLLSTTPSTSTFAPTISTILQQPYSILTDSSVYDYPFNKPSSPKITPEFKHTVFKTIPQIEQTIKNTAPNSFITNENVNPFDLHHRPYSVSRSYLGGDKHKTIHFSPSPNIKATNNHLQSSVYSPFGSLAWENLSSRTQKPQIPFTTHSSPTILSMHPSLPHTHTSMSEDIIPCPSESILLNYKPSAVPIFTSPFISQSNIPSCETIPSTQSSKPFDKNLNTLVSRYLPFNYSSYSGAKYLPNNYQTSDFNNLDYNTHVKPLKYENLCEKKEIINPLFQTDTTLPNIETMANIKDVSEDNEAIDKINDNVNKYIRRNLLPQILNENTITLPLQNTCIAKCNPNDKVYYIKTENPNIELKVWPTEIQLVKAKIVFENEKLEALNFCPVVKKEKSLYSKEVVQNIVENYVKKYYGEPIVVKSLNIQKPNEFVGDINESFIKNDKVYIVWSNLCDC